MISFFIPTKDAKGQLGCVDFHFATCYNINKKMNDILELIPDEKEQEKND
jgi:hypothetical protein